MNKLLKFKAVEGLRNNHKLAQLYGLNEAEESRNEDLDFEHKNK